MKLNPGQIRTLIGLGVSVVSIVDYVVMSRRVKKMSDRVKKTSDNISLKDGNLTRTTTHKLTEKECDQYALARSERIYKELLDEAEQILREGV